MNLINLNDDQWEELVESSLQGTIFHNSFYLKCLGQDCNYFGIEKKGNILAGIALPKSDSLEIRPYQAYNGLIYTPLLESKKVVAKIELKYQIAEFLGSELLDRYDDLALNCIDYLETFDTRGFDWVNYHDPSKEKYRAKVLYTSILETSESIAQSSLRKGRASSLNKAKKHNLVTELSFDINDIENLYLETFNRQEIDLPTSTINIAGQLFRGLMENKKAFIVKTSFEGELASSSIIGFDSKRAYYLFGANKTELRDKEAGSLNIAWAIEYLAKEKKLNELDMVGVNSPTRGSFKLSFGGKLIPYYQIKKISSLGEGK